MDHGGTLIRADQAYCAGQGRCGATPPGNDRIRLPLGGEGPGQVEDLKIKGQREKGLVSRIRNHSGTLPADLTQQARRHPSSCNV